MRRARSRSPFHLAPPVLAIWLALGCHSPPPAEAPIGLVVPDLVAAEAEDALPEPPAEPACQHLPNLAEARRQPVPARYNSAVELARCGRHDDAAELLRELLAAEPQHHYARVQLALQLERKGELDRAIAEVSQAIQDARFLNEEALVQLARLQLKRGSSQEDHDGQNDRERAHKNLQRALAINDRYVPARLLLALYYLELARQRGGGTPGGLIDGAAPAPAPGSAAPLLELAQRVCRDTIAEHPRQAAAHHTLGVVLLEMGEQWEAARAFERALQLDGRLWEARLDLGSVLLAARSFDKAEQIYRTALQQRPQDYDALTGLGVALSGQPGGGKLAEAQGLLARALGIAPQRSAAHYNAAVVYQLAAERTPAGRGAALAAARDHLATFVRLAGGDATLRPAVARAESRLDAIDQELGRTP